MPSTTFFNLPEAKAPSSKPLPYASLPHMASKAPASMLSLPAQVLPKAHFTNTLRIKPIFSSMCSRWYSVKNSL